MNATCTTISGRTQCARSRGRPLAFVNGDFGISMRVEPRAQIEQELRVEAGADLSGKHEIAAFVVADEQRAETDARALRIGEPADDELLRRFALHLQPVLRAAMFVRRAAPLGDHAFPAFAPRALPRLLVVEQLDALHRRLEGQLLQQRAPILERQRGDGACRSATGCRTRDSRCCRPRSLRRRESPRRQAARRSRSSTRRQMSAEADCASTAARRRRACRRAAGCRRTCARTASRRRRTAPLKRSCVSVAAIGSSQSGMGDIGSQKSKV